MPERPSIPFAARAWAGVMAVAATYVYFLLYAQFGLVYLIQSRGGGAADIERAMGAMGLVGLTASLFARRALRRWSFVPLLRGGYLVAGASALLGLALPGVRALLVPAAGAGLGTAIVTVALAANLDRFFPRGRIGLGVGLGTGIAYAFCNLPGLFDGSPAVQTAAVGLFCLAGVRAAGFASPDASVSGHSLPSGRGPFVAALICFFALVWFDSAAFAVIQRTTELKAQTWDGPLHQLTQGATHLATAILAGLLVDRGRLAALWPLAAGLFLAAMPGLQSGSAHVWNGPAYAAAVSLYSVALVAYPVLSAARHRPDAATRAALVYGIAGWLASGLGVGFAQHVHAIPSPVLLGFAAVLLIAWMAPRFPAWSSAQRSAALVLVAAGLAVPLSSRTRPEIPAGFNDPAKVERGRRVYIEEGCMHCHSQYVRPGHGTPDAAWWGPVRPLDRSESPPLVGNRRQGPDLLNVGLRRNADWLRVHFEAPSLVSPSSRMPSYRHLFAPGSTRGEDLVAYLLSRGSGHESERWQSRERWVPAPGDRAADGGRGGELFASSCTACHGGEGRGDGPLAARLNRPGLNLRKGFFLYAPDTMPVTDRRLALARVVKFGVPGTAMAGHETWPDADILDVVEWLLK